jgi:predicted O-linked N-acetylglucosamine transferase (SPINDLY family)
LSSDALRFLTFDDALGRAAAQIREAACDLIYHWEVGSDAMNYFLPFARLAPVQCTSHGSLITTGIPAVDYFYSSGLIETDAADDHYSERLWRSRALLMYQERLPPAGTRSRSAWRLPENCHLYACLQNPLKLHPDFDVLLAGILAADPAGRIVLLADECGHAAAALRNRFARRLPKAADRIIFAPRQRFEDYCGLLQAADVVLDPLHYGAGSSCYDVFSFNLPMVTMPSAMMPGRVGYAFYKKMHFEELVASSAAEYVRKAVQVATDRDYRKYATERIAQASDVLFNDLEVVREHERFFEEALNHVI